MLSVQLLAICDVQVLQINNCLFHILFLSVVSSVTMNANALII